MAVVTALALAGANTVDAPAARGHDSVVVLTATDKQALDEYEARLEDYRIVHRKLEATLPKHGRHPTLDQIDQRQRALGALIKNARAGAAQGDIFTPDMQALVKRTLQAVLGGPDGKTIKALIMDENPGVPDLAVNDRYPDSIPLSTMPHRVLEPLPKLEDEMEYRFVGERLVLMDVEARIVIDLTDDVLP